MRVVAYKLGDLVSMTPTAGAKAVVLVLGPRLVWGPPNCRTTEPALALRYNGQTIALADALRFGLASIDEHDRPDFYLAAADEYREQQNIDAGL